MDGEARMSGQLGRVLIIGGSGMLGRAWREAAAAADLDHTALLAGEFDLTDPADLNGRITDGVAVVVNCAAWTDVDGAESHEAEAMRINGRAVGELAQRCRAVDALLVHYSTDYVFNGSAAAPYRIDEPRDPINAYGRSKALGELLIEQSGCEHLTIRTSWLYAPWGTNFVLTMARLTAEKPMLHVVNDQHGRPTSARHLAQTTIGLLKRGARGTFHATDGGQCTWFELASHINETLGHGCDVQACASDAFPRPAKRPAYSVLDLSETERLIGPMPPWQQQVTQVLTDPAWRTQVRSGQA